MAKRKAAGRKTATRKSSTARASRKTAARKTAARKGAKKKTAARRSTRTSAARKGASAKRAGAKTSARSTAGGAGSRKAVAARGVRKFRAAASKKTAKAQAAPARKAPSLDRVRRVAPEDNELVPSPPSSLDLDRSASAVRTGRREMRERYQEHTETSPALTAGDVDADWESAYSVGDEAPGGDNPTPDQDIVDDIGRAVGNEYQDTEELKGADKIAKRDKHRWELDPASSEDYDDR